MAKSNCSAYTSKAMDGLTVILLVIICMFGVASGRETPNRVYTGVTVKSLPFVDVVDNKFDGFAIDLLDEIKKIVGFDYRLYLSPDGKYGAVESDGSVSGMIGAVQQNRADFAIADLTVTEVRARFVDFTEPFMTVGITALIRRSLAGDMSSFADLADQSRVAYGVVQSGSTYNFFQTSSEPTIQKMYSSMVRNPQLTVRNNREAVNRVNTTNYAFIGESSFIELMAGLYCDLTYIEDRKLTPTRHYAIAVAKDSPLRELFNSAIHQLNAIGKTEELRKKYWRNNCNYDNGYEASADAKGLAGYATIVSLAVGFGFAIGFR